MFYNATSMCLPIENFIGHFHCLTLEREIIEHGFQILKPSRGRKKIATSQHIIKHYVGHLYLCSNLQHNDKIWIQIRIMFTFWIIMTLINSHMNMIEGMYISNEEQVWDSKSVYILFRASYSYTYSHATKQPTPTRTIWRPLQSTEDSGAKSMHDIHKPWVTGWHVPTPTRMCIASTTAP